MVKLSLNRYSRGLGFLALCLGGFWMPKRLESVMRIGKRIGLSDEKGIVTGVFIALIIVASTVAGYLLWFRPLPEEYNTFFLLDSQQQAVNYPEILVAGQNSTFDIYVNVINHMNTEQNYEVKTKIVKHLMLTDQGVIAEPINTYRVTLPSGGSNQTIVTVGENTVGSYQVVYELWRQEENGDYKFTHNYCVLNIQVKVIS